MTTAPDPLHPFVDTYREIEALIAAGMDKAQAEATVYASVRATNAAALAAEARLRAESDIKFQEVKAELAGLRKDIEAVQKDIEGVQKDIEGVRKDVESVREDLEQDIETVRRDVEKDIEGVRRDLDAKLANRLLVLGLGLAGLVLATVGLATNFIVNAG